MRTGDELIAEQRKKVEAATARLHQLEKKEKERQRKADTHNKIVLGGILLKYAGSNLDPEAFEGYCKKYARALSAINQTYSPTIFSHDDFDDDDDYVVDMGSAEDEDDWAHRF